MKMRKKMMAFLTVLLTTTLLCGNASLLYASDQSMTDVSENEIISVEMAAAAEDTMAVEEDLPEECIPDISEAESVEEPSVGEGEVLLSEIGYDNENTVTKEQETDDSETLTPEVPVQIDISSAVVSTKSKSYTYNGYNRKPAVTVVYKKDTTLVKDRDYTVTYKNNKNVGTATYTVTGIGDYCGTVSGTYNIIAKSISGASVKTKSASYKVTGYYRKPVPIVKVNGHTLTYRKDFKLSYKNNKNAGTATVIVTGIGNYKGTAKATFKLISAVATVPVYRLYNRVTGEHFYTVSYTERTSYIRAGWISESIAWYAPKKSNTPIYRVSNPNGGNEHHYTKSLSEKNMLVSLGWNDEGIGWYSDDNKTVPVYRHYNPGVPTGNHHYTASKSESETIVKYHGWKYEGISWYAVKLS